MPEKDGKDATFVDLALNVASPDNTSAFGNLINTLDDAGLELKAWPQRGMLAVLSSDSSQTDPIYHQKDIEVTREGAVVFIRDERFGNGGCKKSGQLGKIHDRDTDTHVQTGNIRRHPGNGVIYYPKSKRPFVLLLAPDKGDVKPADFQAFYFRGNQGFQVAPGVWHQYPYPVNDRSALFAVKESKVFASETIDFSSRYGQEMRFPVDHAHIQALLGSDVIPDLPPGDEPVTGQPDDVTPTVAVNTPMEINIDEGDIDGGSGRRDSITISVAGEKPADTPRNTEGDTSSKMSDVMAELVAVTNNQSKEE